MLGAMAGDIIGSVYEHNTIKTKEFPLFQQGCRFTDDTVLTAAVGEVLLLCGNGSEAEMTKAFTVALRKWGNQYPNAGYGHGFAQWLADASMLAYNSLGNGSAMRVSPVGWAYNNIKDVLRVAALSACVTHNHPEGVRGAQAVAGAVYLARTGDSKNRIKSFIQEDIGYPLNQTLEQIRPGYHFDATCPGSVPQAITCFLEADNFEDAVRNAISLGGDADTLAAMAGSMAEAFYGIPPDIKQKTAAYLDEPIKDLVAQFDTLIASSL